MLSNRLVVAALAVGCISAAAAGGFIAARQNSVPAAAQVQSADGTSAPAPGAPAAQPVQETEAVVGDSPKPPAPVAEAVPIAPPRTAAPTQAVAPQRTARRAAVEAPVRSARTETPRPVTSSPRQVTPTPRPEPPPLASSWPSSANAASSTSASTTTDTSTRAEERTPEVARTPDPPQKQFEELVVSADSVIGLQIESRLSSETAKVEDRVEARVTRDVRVGDRIAIPAGSHAIGSVMQVDRGGKFKERARLGIRFNQLVLADGTRVPISTETIYRDGDAPGNSSAAKVGGGAVGGAILGAILGGTKGAVIGGATGAGGGTAAVMAGGRSEAVLAPGTPLTVRVISPVTITTEKE